MRPAIPVGAAGPAEMTRRDHAIALTVILGMTLLLPIVFHLNPRTIDHFLTTRYAHDLQAGSYRPTLWPQSTRFGMLLPLALLQALLGVNAASSAALTILASLGHVLAVYGLGRVLFSPRTALGAAAIVAVLPLETIQATLLFPDLPAAGAAIGGFALLVREACAEHPRLRFLLLSGALLAVAYLFKQSVVFILLFAAAWAVAGRRWRLWPVAIPLAITMAVESMVLWRLTGDAFFRHSASNTFLADMNQREYFASSSLIGIAFRFPQLLLNPLNRGFPYLMGLAALFVIAGWPLRREPPVRFLVAFCGTLFVLATFWPARLIPYVPALIPDARHLIFLAGPMAVVISEGASRRGRRSSLLIGAAFSILCLLSTGFIRTHLDREDAGDRAAWNFLARQGCRRVRAVDRHGHSSELYAYLSGYSPDVRVLEYRVDDLPELRGEWIVVDDRSRIGDATGVVWISGRDLPIPARWELVWEERFPAPWDPRASSRIDEYRVRIFRAS